MVLLTPFSAIDPQSRQQIRSKLLSLLDEKDSAVCPHYSSADFMLCTEACLPLPDCQNISILCRSNSKEGFPQGLVSFSEYLSLYIHSETHTRDKYRPDLFDNLIGTMTQACESMKHGNDQARLVLHRALLYFQQSVKALSENRTLAGKNIMGGVSLTFEASPLSLSCR